MGFGFEGHVFKTSILILKKVLIQNFKYPDFMKDFHSQVLSKHSEITVSLDGGANTRRPLVFTDIVGTH